MVRSGAGQGEVDAELVVPVVAPPAVGLLLLQLLPQARDGVLEAENVSTLVSTLLLPSCCCYLGGKR